VDADPIDIAVKKKLINIQPTVLDDWLFFRPGACLHAPESVAYDIAGSRSGMRLFYCLPVREDTHRGVWVPIPLIVQQKNNQSIFNQPSWTVGFFLLPLVRVCTHRNR
jgi:hypothetical protein